MAGARALWVATGMKQEQFGKPIIGFAAVAEMLKNMEAKTLASRALLYETARFVDIYKQLNHISHERSLESEERQEMKFYNRLADGFRQDVRLGVCQRGSLRLYPDSRWLGIYEGLRLRAPLPRRTYYEYLRGYYAASGCCRHQPRD